MRDAYIPPGSLVLIELNTSLYDRQARQEIADYVRNKLWSQPVIVDGHDQPTAVHVLTSATTPK